MISRSKTEVLDFARSEYFTFGCKTATENYVPAAFRCSSVVTTVQVIPATYLSRKTLILLPDIIASI
jgi:hypothetical protein